MSRTTDELPGIVRTLSTVQTMGQARIAIGTALKALGEAYKLLDRVPTEFGVPVLGDRYRHSLDIARTNLEAWIGQIAGIGAEDYRADWALKRWKVEKAYVEIAGVEGAAEYTPRTSNLEILMQALREAPALFGEELGNILEQVGNAAGNLGKGIASGLGWKGTAWAVVIVAVGLVVVTNGQILTTVKGIVKS